jgi:hypothetical protein
MWNAGKQRRLNSLLEKQEQGRLSSPEAEELQGLADERIRFEADALSVSTHQIAKSAEQAQQTRRAINSQARDLEELIRDQKSYLAEVNSIIKEMESRRRGWRARYKRVTGRPLTEPISPAAKR